MPTGTDRLLARRAMRSSGAVSELWTLVLSPKLDGERQAPTLTDRSEAPCGVARCPQAFVLGAPFADEREAEEKATRELRTRPGPGAMRWFVGLELRAARAVDCRAGALCLTERDVLEQEPRTLRLVRALHDEGADVVWIRATRDGRAIRMAIFFTGAFGRRIDVLEEGPRMLCQDDSWRPLQAMSAPRPAPEGDRARSAAAPPHARRWARRLLLDLVSALVCSVAAKALVALAGVRVSVPLWALLAAVFAAVLMVRAVVARTSAAPAGSRRASSPPMDDETETCDIAVA